MKCVKKQLRALRAQEQHEETLEAFKSMLKRNPDLHLETFLIHDLHKDTRYFNSFRMWLSRNKLSITELRNEALRENGEYGQKLTRTEQKKKNDKLVEKFIADLQDAPHTYFWQWCMANGIRSKKAQLAFRQKLYRAGVSVRKLNALGQEMRDYISSIAQKEKRRLKERTRGC